MFLCSIRKRTRTSDHRLFGLLLACAILFLGSISFAEISVPGPPPQNPADYGRVVLDSYAAISPGPVEFDHWLHRSMFTCRLCHVDIGFAMQAKATGIRAGTNRQGFHCGACHDGKRTINGKTVFASCSTDGTIDKRCARCHFSAKGSIREYGYQSYTAKFTKGAYGIDWLATESAGRIKLLDSIEGLSVKGPAMQNKRDLSILATESWVQPITFSHQKHTVWCGCELCHPEIFPPAGKDRAPYSMYSNIRGRFCGACHGRVAFPLNNCNGCHASGPDWVEY